MSFIRNYFYFKFIIKKYFLFKKFEKKNDHKINKIIYMIYKKYITK